VTNEVWVVEHSGKDFDDWYVWDSTPHASQTEAVVAKQILEPRFAEILKFRVVKYTPEPSADVGGRDG
jgi:hypothetical protein